MTGSHVSAFALRFALLLTVAATGCRTATPFTCDAHSIARAPRNFGAVVEDGRAVRVYRGGQPTSCTALAFLKSLGVKNIVKLNDRHSPLDDAEEKEATRLGLHVERFDFSARTIGEASTCDRVAAALAFLRDESHGPTFVHCTAGRDRTGYLIGLYEKVALQRSTAEVLRELHEYGHRGATSAAFHQIDRELQRDVPQCAMPLR